MTLSRRRRIILWSGVALLLAAGSYLSAYYQSVVRTTRFRVTSAGQVVAVVPSYHLPSPIPSRDETRWLRKVLPAFFAPAHQLDRTLRPDVWPEPMTIPLLDIGP
jgi:hypothetical protein